MINEHQITFELADKTRVNTWNDWHLVPTERPTVKPPEPKYSYTEIQASDGKLDSTDFPNGYPSYNNRTGSWEFYVMNSLGDLNTYYGTWYDRYSKIMNTIQGREVKVYLDDQPDYYYVGRIHVSDHKPERTWSKITIDYDLFPYKYSVDDYGTGEETVNGETIVNVIGSDMPVFPTITASSTTYIFNPNQAATRAMVVQMLYKYHIYNRNQLSTTAKALQVTIDNTLISTTTLPFIDIPEDAYYLDALKWMYGKKYVAGYTNELFVPNNGCTRAQFIQILWRLKNSPNSSESIPFVDVKNTDYYYTAVRWAYEKGYISGTSANTFSPNQVITRAQAVFIIWCAAGRQDASLSEDESVTDVTDEQNKPWYYDAVKWTWTHGYMAGTTSNRFDPATKSTRGHFFTVLLAWYGGHMTNQPYDGTWPSKLAAWKIQQTNYKEPSELRLFKSDMLSAGLGYDADELERMWTWVQTGITEALDGDGVDDYPFTDTRKSDYFYYPSVWARYKQYTQGVDAHTFGGNIPILRWQCVYCLWLVAGDGTVGPTAKEGNRAKDVSPTAIYAKAVDWAVENGVTELESNGNFNPGGNATRAMVAQFFYKLEQTWGSPDLSTSEEDMPFKDVPDGKLYYKTAVDWALQNGIAAKAGSGLTIVHDGFEYHVDDGTNLMPFVPILKGNNQLVFKGKGKVQIAYKRGSL